MQTEAVSDGGDDWVYVVTDIEVDGPWPGPNSMRAFASVAISLDGTRHGEFEAVLDPLPGAAPDAATLAWFQTQPEAWQAATTGARPVADVLARYTAWVTGLPQRRMFAASPLGFDGPWLDYYLRRFTGYGLVQGLDEIDPLFTGPGLCIRSYAAAITGRPVADLTADSLPPEWLGHVEHTHRAIDDARGYANLLLHLTRRVSRP
jgi:hypothetical protein